MKRYKLTFLTPAAWLMCLLMCLVSFQVSAALDGYMRITGADQEEIMGSVTQAGREGSMEVIEFTHNVSQSLDSASGLPSGKRQHRPVRIIKPIDKATPLLFNALKGNEILTTVRIDLYRPNPQGQEEQYYTVELVNARISNISQFNSSDEEFRTLRARETISFVYDKIIWTWRDGTIEAEDDW